MEQRISLAVKAFGITHTSELPEDCTAAELIESFSKLAESIGYSPTLVITGLESAIDSRI